MKELNKIVKEIKFVGKKNRSRVSHYVHLELINGSSTEIFMESDLFNAIKVLNEINGVNPVVKKELVEEKSENTDKVYKCVRLELCDGSVFRLFPKFAFELIINAVYAKYLQDQTKEQKETKK